MTKRQYATEDYDSDGGFVEDAPKGKKQKKALSSEMQKDAEGSEYWNLSDKRRVQVSDFKGTTMVGVREFYEKDGRILPGKKGISLSMDQYKTFITLLPDIERVLAAKGIDVPRPEYGEKPSVELNEDDEVEADSKRRVKKSSKPNHEATSDEDEG